MLSPIRRTPTVVLCLVSVCVALVSFAFLARRQQAATPTVSSPASADTRLGPARSGANESPLAPFASITVNSTSDVANGTDGLCTLREAITAAHIDTASGAIAGECAAGSGDDTISFTVTGTITLLTSLPQVGSNMSINGPGSNLLTIARSSAGGTPQFRIFEVNAVVNISGVTVTNGATTTGPSFSGPAGGGILNFHTLTLTDVIVSGNTTGEGLPGGGVGGGGGNGGGIYNSSGTLTMTSCIVSGNTAGQGGAGASAGGPGGAGGGIHNNGTLIMTDCSVTGNNAGKGGDGVAAGGNGGPGGGIYNTQVGASVSMTDCIVSGNNAGSSGDGGGPTNGGHGGGIITLGGITTLTRVTLSNNSAGDAADTGVGGNGGAISIEGQAEVRLINSTVNGNQSGSSTSGTPGWGGGISNGVALNVTGSTINNNTTETVGGGIANRMSSAVLEITNSTVSGNQASGSGAGIYDDGAVMKMTNCTVTNHTSIGFSASGPGTRTVRSSIIAGNGTDLEGSFTSQGNNLIGKSDGTNGFTNGSNGDQVGTLAAPLDPQLGLLANNGGPTQTHALLADSSAIDAGNNCVLTDTCSPALGFSLTTDQRGAGFARSSDGDGNGTATVDIGAFEVQTILVTNTDDSGPGSLRQVIIDANASAGTEAISFQTGLTGTISLLSELPALTSMSLNGPGAHLMTIERNSAAAEFGIFRISTGNHNVSFYRLSISGGRITGGILNDSTGTVNVTDCAITGNTSAITEYGGGIRNGNTGTLNITRSTISGNSTPENGGGLAVLSGTVNVTNSTISGNSASGQGGGIDVNNVATVNLTNCTISNNRGDDLGNSGGGAGGLANGGFGTGKPFLKNTIVAGNFTGTGTTASDINGPMDPASSFNLIGTGIGMGISHGSNGNQIGTPGSPLNPLLGVLANNGGPTLTHALLLGSPALDAGSNALSDAASLATDQRGAGFIRKADGDGNGTSTVDIGAYEVNVILVTNTDDSGPGSLRQAIIDANTSANTDAINFQAGVTGTINLLTALPDLSTSMSINGPGANLLTVQRSPAGGTPNFRILKIDLGTSTTIRNLTISNGKLINSGDLGAGVLNNGELTLANCNIYGNQAVDLPGRGGGIYSDGPSLVLNNCNIGGSAAGQPNIGGGIVIVGSFATLLITGGSVVGNTSAGIFFGGLDATLNGVSITNNTGTSATGGFWSNGSTQNVKIFNCLIANNIGQNGGGLRNGGGTHLVVNTTISGNTSLAFGGGLDNWFGNTTLINVTITNNRAQDGGGVFNWSGVGAVLLQNTIVAGNFKGASPSTTPGDIANLVSSSSSFNLIGSCDGCGLSNGGVNENHVGVANPGLDLLANNGGPTLTHALLKGSLALDAGSNALSDAASLTTDQRGAGFIRKADSADANTTQTVDIGAFEAQASVEDITDKATSKDTPLSFGFNVGDAALITGVTASSSNTTLVPNLPANLNVTGSGSTRTLNITPAANQTGTSTITVTVTSGSESMSDTFVLTVTAPDISVAVSPSAVAEDGATNLVYTFTRTGVTTGALTVNFSVGVTPGSATFGTDYTQTGATTFLATSGTVTFGAGNATTMITLNPSPDTTVEGDETALLTVTANTGYNVGSPSGATGTITNDDTNVSVAVSPSAVAEDGATNLVYTFTRAGVTTGALTGELLGGWHAGVGDVRD